MATSAPHCAHSECKCSIDQATAVQHDGKSYCSERCADDRGCDHHGCNCGVFPTDETATERVVR